MKRINALLVFLLILTTFELFGQTNPNPVLLSIENRQVTKEEFVRIYKKNNNLQSADDQNKSVNDYLELFINFKLKVIEAENLGLDTAQTFTKELAGYRKQLARPYLTDDKIVDSLVKEAYTRSLSEVEASHILIKLEEAAAPADTLKAYDKIMKIRQRLLKGEDFAKVAKETSEDPSVEKNGGYLGYFTAFQMIYPFESAAFSTKIGDISQPVRTQFGYHLIKVQNRRESQGKVRVAHIMMIVQENQPPEAWNVAKQRIDSIYLRLRNGDDFSQLAMQYSDDKRSGSKGGELNWFSIGQMVPEFEEASFALKNTNDISAPVKTDFGWHIIKLLERKGAESFDEVKETFRRRVSGDERVEISRNAVVERIKRKNNFKEITSKSEFYTVLDTTIFAGTWTQDKAAKLNKQLFTLGDSVITQQDFAAYLALNKAQVQKVPIEVYVDNKYQAFIQEVALKYEEDRLEQSYPDFKYLMNEYHDGILLFELTDQMVWSKAVKDTVGLQQYFDKQQNKYMWDERIEATIFKYKDDSQLKVLEKLLNKREKYSYSDTYIVETLNKKDSTYLTLVKSDKFSRGDDKLIDNVFTMKEKGELNVKAKYIYFKESNQIVYVLAQLPPQPKLLSEVRGIVTAEYQNYLEEEWLKGLKMKYTITVNKDVLSTIE